MKIAILITAYKNEIQINNLIEHLRKDFDIYIHIDKRSSININKYNNVNIYHKYNSYWGSFNTVLATLWLLREASKNNYDRYVQITGQDLPIKSNREILLFFEQNKDKNFIEYFKLPTKSWNNGGIDRITKYWAIEPSKLIGFEKFKANLFKFVLSIAYKLPFSFLFYRSIKFDFYGGSMFMDLTNHCVKKILEIIEDNPKILNRFKYTYIPEETFFQTIILNSISKSSIENKALRFVDWQNGPEYPKILTMNDYEKIIISEYIFARKFDETKDNDVIIKILDTTK